MLVFPSAFFASKEEIIMDIREFHLIVSASFSILLLFFACFAFPGNLAAQTAEWQATITATSSDASLLPVSVSFGVAHDATDGIDAGLDVLTELPPPSLEFGPYLQVVLAGSDMVFLSTDIRQVASWILIVASNADFILSWDISSAPPEIPLILAPGGSIPVIDMRETNNTSVSGSGGYIGMTIRSDVTPPAPVTAFTASNPTNTTLDLTWTNSLDTDFAGTLIVRSQNAITWVPTPGFRYNLHEVVVMGVVIRYLGADDHSATPFTDTELSSNTTYHYKAFAYDTSHNYSDGVETSGMSLPAVGDVSGNDHITAYDAFMVLQHRAGLIELSSWQQQVADVYNDGIVNETDAVYILKYVVGLITSLPVVPASPAFYPENATELLIEAIKQLETTRLTREQRQVLNRLIFIYQKRTLIHTGLFQNYPNPFNPDTWLPYKLAKDTPVTIRIYNAKGQLVRLMNLGTQRAGVYLSRDKAAYWNGKDSLGQSVASGVYFYTLQTGNLTATRRMLIVK